MRENLNRKPSIVPVNIGVPFEIVPETNPVILQLIVVEFPISKTKGFPRSAYHLRAQGPQRQVASIKVLPKLVCNYLRYVAVW